MNFRLPILHGFFRSPTEKADNGNSFSQDLQTCVPSVGNSEYNFKPLVSSVKPLLLIAAIPLILKDLLISVKRSRFDCKSSQNILNRRGRTHEGEPEGPAMTGTRGQWHKHVIRDGRWYHHRCRHHT